MKWIQGLNNKSSLNLALFKHGATDRKVASGLIVNTDGETFRLNVVGKYLHCQEVSIIYTMHT